METSEYPNNESLSFETAIVVFDVEEEYEYLRMTYPGFQHVKQQVLYHQETPFDLITIELLDGTERVVYFDISEFFGKDEGFNL